MAVERELEWPSSSSRSIGSFGVPATLAEEEGAAVWWGVAIAGRRGMTAAERRGVAQAPRQKVLYCLTIGMISGNPYEQRGTR